LENLSLSEGGRVLVTVMPDEDEQQFWIDASERSLAAVLENTVGFLHSPSSPIRALTTVTRMAVAALIGGLAEQLVVYLSNNT
jgi:hypothetical protein